MPFFVLCTFSIISMLLFWVHWVQRAPKYTTSTSDPVIYWANTDKEYLASTLRSSVALWLWGAIMLAFLIGIPVVPALIACGVLASQVHVFSNLASMVLNALPNFMVTTYLFIDDMLNIIAWGKGKVGYNFPTCTVAWLKIHIGSLYFLLEILVNPPFGW